MTFIILIVFLYFVTGIINVIIKTLVYSDANISFNKMTLWKSCLFWPYELYSVKYHNRAFGE
jgi:hypothetical protein